MVTRLIGFALRVIAECAVMLIVGGVILLSLGWRLGKKTLVDRPDRIEILSGAGPMPWQLEAVFRGLDIAQRARAAGEPWPETVESDE